VRLIYLETQTACQRHGLPANGMACQPTAWITRMQRIFTDQCLSVRSVNKCE